MDALIVDPNKEQSLKDAYAGYALAGLLARSKQRKLFENIDEVYKLINGAWSIAELMVRARRGPLAREKSSESES